MSLQYLTYCRLYLQKNRSDLETEPHKRNGLSWMNPGTTQIFSRDDTDS